MISYSDLLDVFWYSHNPAFPSSSRQYMSIIFYHDEEQKKLALESRDRLQAETGRNVYTEIVPVEAFYSAEDYHQKYYLQHHAELMKELMALYPDFEDLVDSTAAARLNGYAGGYGSEETLQEDIADLGLSLRGIEIVEELAGRGLKQACPAAL